MKLTLKDLLEYATNNGLGKETEIEINGCELHHMFIHDGKIYLDETENGENEQKRKVDGKCLEVYLVTTKYGSSDQDKVYPFRAFWDGINFTDGWRILDVIAWTPLPEPYKQNDEGAEK